MTDVLHDLRQAFRTFLNYPGFAASVVTTLALAIGANTATFTLVHAVLLQPLPFPEPDRLVMFSTASPQDLAVSGSPTKFNVWRKDTETFQDVSAYFFGTIDLVEAANPEQLRSGHVSASFFRLFGASMTTGRTFTATEDLPNGGDVAVLGYRFWQRRFGGAADVIGKTLPLSGVPHSIVGILDPGFDPESLHSPFGVTAPIDVWLPLQVDPGSQTQSNTLLVAGRLAPHATLAKANARLRAATTEFRAVFPQAIRPAEEFRVTPLHDVVVNDVQTPLLVLLAAVGFVLLLACANVANMMLVRALRRQREMAIRAALGASRGRIVRQLLTESLLLSLLGGAIGFVVGRVFLRALVLMSPVAIPGLGTEGVGTVAGWAVMAFTSFVAILTALACGLFPALLSARGQPLYDAARSGFGGTEQSKARAVLVVLEAGLALLLVVGAALLIRTFIAMRTVDAGFDSRHVLTVRMSLTDARMSTTAAVDRLVQAGVQRLVALPGVAAAAATCCLPLENDLGLRFVIDGRALDGAYHGMAGWRFVSPAYFEVFDIPLMRGRRFADSDTAGAAPVVIINQTMARQYWPEGDPLAQRLIIGRGIGPEFQDPVRRIVGIVGDVRDGSLQRAPRPTMYVPLAQVPDSITAMNNRFLPLAWIVRTNGDPAAMGAQVGREIQKASAGRPTARLRTMNEIVAQSTGRAEFNMVVVTIFGGVALLLAALGIYGLMAHSVQQRTREMGIRLALGATPAGLLRRVVWQGTRLALLGGGIGLAGAFGLTRFMESLLFGVTPLDPLVFIAVPVVLSVVAAIAAWLPARRVSRIDPVLALRAE